MAHSALASAFAPDQQAPVPDQQAPVPFFDDLDALLDGGPPYEGPDPLEEYFEWLAGQAPAPLLLAGIGGLALACDEGAVRRGAVDQRHRAGEAALADAPAGADGDVA